MDSYPRVLHATDAPHGLRTLIAQLVPLLLDGPAPALAILRAQYEGATLREIELTGAGYFASFEVPGELPRVTPDRWIGGSAVLDVEGLDGGAGALLIVSKGALDALEVYVNGDGEFPIAAKARIVESSPIEVPSSIP